MIERKTAMRRLRASSPRFIEVNEAMQANHRRRLTAGLRLLALVVMLTVASARGWAEPVILKLSFFTSDRSVVYLCHIKSLVDAVNADGVGLVQIKVYFSGAISPSQTEQPNLVLSRAADMALIVPGLTPQEFPDSLVFALPGLFRDDDEASLVFTRLIEDRALEGYSRCVVIGAHVSAAENTHSRKPIATISDLKGQGLRVNNSVEADALRRLRASPVQLPLNRTMDALSQGTVDGAVVDPSVLAEFGFSRLAQNHYLLDLGAAPLALVMNRDAFAGLPPRAQDIIRKYSGDRAATIWIDSYGRNERGIFETIRAKPDQKIIEPSREDAEAGHRVFESIITVWAAQDARNAALLKDLQAELTALRAPK